MSLTYPPLHTLCIEVDIVSGLIVFIISSLFGLFFTTSYAIITLIVGLLQAFQTTSLSILQSSTQSVARNESMTIQNNLLQNIIHVTESIQESLGAPELAACQVGYKEYCPTGISEDTIACEMAFWECKTKVSMVGGSMG